jgi:hypothetical protein
MRMYDRVLRADLYSSDRFVELPTDTHRLIFAALVHLADDFGNLEGAPVALWRWAHTFCQVKSRENMVEILSRLCDVDLLRGYEVDGKAFFHMPRFRNARKYWRRICPPSPWCDPSAYTGPRSNQVLSSDSCDAAGVRSDPDLTQKQPDLTDGVGVGVGVGVGEKTNTLVALRPPACPVRKIVATYNEVCRGCTRSEVPTAALHGHIAARWRQLFLDGAAKDYADAAKFFADFFERVQSSRFLTGQAKARDGSKPFRASLRWLMKPENFAKTIEGEYDNR